MIRLQIVNLLPKQRCPQTPLTNELYHVKAYPPFGPCPLEEPSTRRLADFMDETRPLKWREKGGERPVKKARKPVLLIKR